MFPTIIGTETEYGSICKKPDGKLHNFFVSSSNFFRWFLMDGLPQDIFSPLIGITRDSARLLDGSRCYLDSRQVEWATREELGVGNAVLAEIAGDIVLGEACERVNKLWKTKKLEEEMLKDGLEQGIEVYLLRNNLDKDAQIYNKPNGWVITYGFHENYTMERKEGEGFEVITDVLAPFLITRPVFSGSGWFCKYGDKILYLLSQRTAVVTNLIGHNTTSNRPIINTRDEPHSPRYEGKDIEIYRRLHIIMGDAVMLQAARWLQLGTTEILIDAVGCGYLKKCPLGIWGEEELMTAMHCFNEDASLNVTCNLGTRHGKLSAVDIQEIYRDTLWEYCSKTGRWDKERKFTFELWNEVIKRARKPRPHEELAPYADWAQKLLLAELDAERHGYSLNDPPEGRLVKFEGKTQRRLSVFERLKEFDFLFPLILPEKGLAWILERKGETMRIFSDEEIFRAKYFPLSLCRSRARAVELRALVEYMKRTGRRLTVDINWGYTKAVFENKVIYSNPPNHEVTLNLKDPFDYTCDISCLLEQSKPQGKAR